MDLWLVAFLATSSAAVVLVLLRAVMVATRLSISTGTQALIGKEGVASSELAPEGTVRVDSESWTARAERAPIHRGEKIEVVAVEGVVLRVKKQQALGDLSLAPQERRNA